MGKEAVVQGCEVKVYVSQAGDVQCSPIVAVPLSQRVKAEGKVCYFGQMTVSVATATHQGWALSNPVQLVIRGTATRVKSLGQAALLKGDKSNAFPCVWEKDDETTTFNLTAEITDAGQTKVKFT